GERFGRVVRGAAGAVLLGALLPGLEGEPAVLLHETIEVLDAERLDEERRALGRLFELVLDADEVRVDRAVVDTHGGEALFEVALHPRARPFFGDLGNDGRVGQLFGPVVNEVAIAVGRKLRGQRRRLGGPAQPLGVGEIRYSL